MVIVDHETRDRARAVRHRARAVVAARAPPSAAPAPPFVALAPTAATRARARTVSAVRVCLSVCVSGFGVCDVCEHASARRPCRSSS